MAKSEPHKFWKKIKKSYKKQNVKANNLNVQDLHDHFKNMFGELPTEQRDTQPDVNQITYVKNWTRNLHTRNSVQRYFHRKIIKVQESTIYRPKLLKHHMSSFLRF